MHADDYGGDGGICGVGGEHLLEPCDLIVVELIWRSIVECDEVDASALPVVVGVEAMIFRFVAETLLLEFGRVEPVGKLD